MAICKNREGLPVRAAHIDPTKAGKSEYMYDDIAVSRVELDFNSSYNCTQQSHAWALLILPSCHQRKEERATVRREALVHSATVKDEKEAEPNTTKEEGVVVLAQ
jgi:hypothetical protein